MGDEDDQNQECKCYKVLSVKPITDSDQVFDMLSAFLQKDRKRQQSAAAEGDPVREKSSWKELRRWANSLLTENETSNNNNNIKKRKPIDDWVNDFGQTDDQDDYEDEFEEGQRLISDGIVKLESAEATGRSEVAIAGRSADESFVDHVSDEVDNGASDAEKDKAETKEERRARKKAKKEAKKEKRAKKEAKKLAKKEKKSSKPIKTEE